MSASAISAQLALAAQPAESRLYPQTVKVLHWTTALLVAAQFPLGVAMKHLGAGPLADFLFTLHKTSGFAILLLIVARIGLRAAMLAMGRWRRYAPMLKVHAILYLAMLLVPLLGLAGISDYGARTIFFGLSLPSIWPEGAGYADLLFAAHGYLAFALLVLVAIHIGVALGLHMMRGAAGDRRRTDR